MNVDRKEYDAGIRYIDRMIDAKIATLAWGDSTAKRRDVKDDPQLVKALQLLRKSQSTKDLLALAAATPATGAQKPK